MAEAGTHIDMPADGGEAALLDSPFEVGEAPFRVKGNAYRGHLDYVAKQIPGGIEAHDAALRALHPEHGEKWAAFMAQPFLASGWYDVYPLAIVGIACARMLGLPFLEFVGTRSTLQARVDVRGIHKFLLKFVSTKGIAKRVPMLAAQYFTFATVTSSVTDNREVHGEQSGVPVAMAPWWAAMSSAYIAAVIEISGRVVPQIDTGPFVLEAPVHGVEICAVHTRVLLPQAPPSA